MAEGWHAFHARRRCLVPAMLALSLATGPALAQANFGEGSFEEGSFAPDSAQPPAAGPGPEEGGFDEGSFEEGSFEDGAPGSESAGAPDQGAPPAVPPDDGGGGSFDPDFEITSPQPAPEPQPQPQPQPTAQVPAEILAFETRDFGVPPTQQLRSGQFHAPTPTELPGGSLVSTEGLAQALSEGVGMILIDVLGGDYGLPSALMAPAMASPGQYRDRIQQQTVQWLGQISGGDPGVPIVVYCSDPMCWLSYNAGLRAIAAGYGNVYWYRGGLQAWTMAGLPLVPSGF